VAIAIDATFPKTVIQDNIALANVSLASTFDVSASRLVVVVAAWGQATGSSTSVGTLTWSGGTPAGAADFSLAVSSGIDGGAGRFTYCSGIWTSWVTSAITNQNIVHAIPDSAVTGGRGVAVYSISGCHSSIGASAQNGQNLTSDLVVRIITTTWGSMVLGIIGSEHSGAAQTAYVGTTYDSDMVQTGWGARPIAAHMTASPATGVQVMGSNEAQGGNISAAIEILPIPISIGNVYG
jgi:hypothetical protein